MKEYKVEAPIGNVVVPKEVMNEKELRDFASQIANNSVPPEVWQEKVQKDEIELVVEWLNQAGYSVTEK
jgi:hypothetical protein